MRGIATTSTITARLADTFYTEAMLLADETRSYLDSHGSAEREALPPYRRVLFACESLNATTRLMQVIAWLLTQRAIGAGEVPDGGDRASLPDVEPIDPDDLAALPAEARRLFGAGIDLHDRVRRLDEGTALIRPTASPARALLQRIERSF